MITSSVILLLLLLLLEKESHRDIRPTTRGHQTHTPAQQTPHPSHNNRTNTRTHNIDILQLNIDSIRNKIEQLTHFMHTNNIHITLLQETKVRQTHNTPAIKHYTPLRRDRRQGEGGRLITFIHHTIRYTDTTDVTKPHQPRHHSRSTIQQD